MSRTKKMEVITCELCGVEKEVEFKKTYGKTRRFCSKEHSQEYTSKNFGALYRSR